MRYLEIEPARAKNHDPEQIWGSAMWILEPKLDGWRWIMHFGRDLDRTFLTGRRHSKETDALSEKGLLVPQLWITNEREIARRRLDVVHIADTLGELSQDLRPDCGYTVLDGEIMPPSGAGFRDIASIMNADVATVRETVARIGPPTYTVFDVLFADGEDVREYAMIERRRILQRVLTPINNPLIKLIPQLPAELSTYDSIVDAGGEGVILKNISGGYGESGSWIKVKKYSTLDVVVTGFTDARYGRTGKYEGQIGAARVSVWRDDKLVEVGQVSGMTDETRLDMTNEPSRWIGNVIEIAAQEFARDRLRHPRFKRARPDADARHATWSKMMRDLKQDAKTESRVVTGEQACLPF